ncbi:Uncharacterised protein [Vibrio cholerae]|nr:Uncharacterised protein [Vibrio cholerae]
MPNFAFASVDHQQLAGANPTFFRHFIWCVIPNPDF